MASTIHSAFLPSKQAAEEVGSHAVKMRCTRKGRAMDGRLHRFICNEQPMTNVSSGLGEQHGSDSPQGRLRAYQLVSGEDLWRGSETVQRRTSEKGQKNSLAQVLRYKSAFHSGKFHFLSDKLSFLKEKVTLFLKTVLGPHHIQSVGLTSRLVTVPLTRHGSLNSWSYLSCGL